MCMWVYGSMRQMFFGVTSSLPVWCILPDVGSKPSSLRAPTSSKNLTTWTSLITNPFQTSWLTSPNIRAINWCWDLCTCWTGSTLQKSHSFKRPSRHSCWWQMSHGGFLLRLENGYHAFDTTWVLMLGKKRWGKSSVLSTNFRTCVHCNKMINRLTNRTKTFSTIVVSCIVVTRVLFRYWDDTSIVPAKFIHVASESTCLHARWSIFLH